MTEIEALLDMLQSARQTEAKVRGWNEAAKVSNVGNTFRRLMNEQYEKAVARRQSLEHAIERLEAEEGQQVG